MGRCSEVGCGSDRDRAPTSQIDLGTVLGDALPEVCREDLGGGPGHRRRSHVQVDVAILDPTVLASDDDRGDLDVEGRLAVAHHVGRGAVAKMNVYDAADEAVVVLGGVPIRLLQGELAGELRADPAEERELVVRRPAS